MLVYIRDGSAQTIVRTATLRYKLKIKLSISPSCSILTPGWPVPALTPWCQTLGKVATGVPIFKSPVWLDREKSGHMWDSNPRSSALEADALTTWPTKWSGHMDVYVHFRGFWQQSSQFFLLFSFKCTQYVRKIKDVCVCLHLREWF